MERLHRMKKVLNMMKKAVLTEPLKPLRIESCPVPPTPADGVRVRIDYAGVCHSDVHYHDGYIGKKVDFLRTFQNGYSGTILGHEIAGVVDDIGPNAKPKFRVGERVIVYPWKGCMRCSYCHNGMGNICPHLAVPGNEHIGCNSPHGGGFATHIVLPTPSLLVPIPDGMPSDLACMLPCSAVTAYSALRKTQKALEVGFKLNQHSKLLILGIGGLGLWALKLAPIMFKHLNVKITAADISLAKVKEAERQGHIGVQLNKDSTIDEAVQMIRKESNGRIEGAVDFVGSPVSSSIGTKILMQGGAVVLVGLYGGNYTTDIPIMNTKAFSVSGSQTGSQQELKELVSLVAENNISFPVEHYRLEEINNALENLRAGSVQGRAILDISQSAKKKHLKSSL